MRHTQSNTSGPYCWGFQYNYDAWGNLLAQAGWSPNYNGCSEATMGSVSADGNNHISGFSYDTERQITSAAGVSYSYDGDGRRVAKLNSSGQATKLYWYGIGSDPLDETDGAGSTTNTSFFEHVFFNGQHVARRDASNNVIYYFADHLGTSRVVTNSSGTILDDSDFYPFGGERPITSSSGNTYKFTGKERDPESGLDNFGARYDSSSMGRFMSPDPKILSLRHIINPQKWNKYAYTINNPLRYFDPNGMEEIEVQLRAYIPQANQGPFKGDNRGPTTSQNVTSRTSITIRVETDPSKAANPLLSKPASHAGQSENLLTGKKDTQTVGLPAATVTRDDKGNVVINITQDAKLPLTPQSVTPGIKSDLNITIPPDASSVTTAGTVSGSPAFELNVSTEGGSDVNIPLQGASSNPLAFGANLSQTNSILNFTPLPPPPPPCPTGQSNCPK